MLTFSELKLFLHILLQRLKSNWTIDLQAVSGPGVAYILITCITLIGIKMSEDGKEQPKYAS